MLGFTTRDHVRVVWGDTDVAPPTNAWYAGNTITYQGAAVCSATDKLRKDLLLRASTALGVDRTKLQIQDGVISSTEDPRKRTTFAALVAANKGPLRQAAQGGAGTRVGRSRMKGTGACFVEVEVDTWTGAWRFLKTVYSHDVGLICNPLVGEADMHGSLVESAQMTTDPLPIDREFPGTRHYSVGYLSYRLPTIMDVPEEQTQVFIDSLEPRWFYGMKSFSETTIGAVPGALANAIYNACGVRVREHPISREKIMAGLKANAGRT
jgi:CO/xanthine dehydrogenase Mo-binding subunit